MTTVRAALGLALVMTAGACNAGRSGTDATSSASSRPAASTSAPAPGSGSTLPGAPPPGAAPPGAAPAHAEADDELSTRPMELMRFRFTSGIEGREAKDELDHAKPGQRVYAYLALRNRTGRPRTVTLAWKVNGESRTTTDLTIDESWQFRTWGYNTLLAKDVKGTLELEVTDDAGHPIVEKKLPIRR